MHIMTSRALQHKAAFPKEVTHLAGLLGITPEEAGNRDIEVRLEIMRKLLAALIAERQRGKAMRDGTAGGWLYDINRHINLAAALDAEMAAINLRAHELSPVEARHALAIVTGVVDENNRHLSL